jgi:hypothetical protein
MGNGHQIESVAMQTFSMLSRLWKEYSSIAREIQIWGLIHYKESYPPRLEVWIHDGGKSMWIVEKSQATLW